MNYTEAMCLVEKVLDASHEYEVGGRTESHDKLDAVKKQIIKLLMFAPSKELPDEDKRWDKSPDEQRDESK